MWPSERDNNLEQEHDLEETPTMLHKGSSSAPLRPSAGESRSIARCSSSAARAYLPYEAAIRYEVLPLSLLQKDAGAVLTLATAEALPPGHISDLRFATGCEIHTTPIERHTLLKAIYSAYRGDDDDLVQTLRRVRAGAPLRQEKHDLPFIPDQGDAARLLGQLIHYGLARGASDLHLVPTFRGTFVRLRIGSELLGHDQPLCDAGQHRQLLSRLKVLAKLDLTSKLPQDGAFEIPADPEPCAARVSTMPTYYGEKGVIRYHGWRDTLSLDRIGFDPILLAELSRILDTNHGLLLFCGPTGSGKSTTMYSVMAHLAARGTRSLMSIEDPVEAPLAGVTQTSLNERQGLTYETCLRAALRQDPDVIMIGEMRDDSSGKIALQAATTGHLLLSSLHSATILDLPLRLRALAIEERALLSIRGMVICQRLIPALCPHCRVIDLESSNRLRCEVYQPVGCQECDLSGCAGRVLAYEYLVLDHHTHQAVANEWSSATLERLGPRYYAPFGLSMQRLVRSGSISVTMASRFA